VLHHRCAAPQCAASQVCCITGVLHHRCAAPQCAASQVCCTTVCCITGVLHHKCAASQVCHWQYYCDVWRRTLCCASHAAWFRCFGVLSIFPGLPISPLISWINLLSPPNLSFPTSIHVSCSLINLLICNWFFSPHFARSPTFTSCHLTSYRPVYLRHFVRKVPKVQFYRRCVTAM
jgi:hypothetical protein